MSEIVSNSCVPLPLFGCLSAAEEFLGRGRTWRPAGEQAEQARLVDLLPRLGADSAHLKPTEFMTLASIQAEDINAWFKRNGFTIELRPAAPSGFASGAIVRLGSEWFQVGTRSQLQGKNGKQYDAVLHTQGVQIADTDGHPHPVVRIAAKSGDTWCLTLAESDLRMFDLLERVAAISQSAQPDRSGNKPRVLWPMINYDQSMEHGWLTGLWTLNQSGDKFFVDQCLQQTRIKLNDKGGLAESAAGMTMRAVSVPRYREVVIDSPCWFWIERPGCALPIFAAQFGYDCWNDPGEIQFDNPIKA